MGNHLVLGYQGCCSHVSPQPALGTLWDHTWGAEEYLLALLWL